MSETDAEMAARLQKEWDDAPVAPVSDSIPISAQHIVSIPSSGSLLGSDDPTSNPPPPPPRNGGATVVQVPSGSAHVQVARPGPINTLTAIPIMSFTHRNSDESEFPEGAERLVAIYSMSKAIRTFAAIDAFFVICYMGFFSIAFACAGWGPFFGYLSAHYYSHRRGMVYLIYYYLKIFLDLLVLYTFGSLFTVFTLLINIFIASAVSRWCRVLKTVTDDERSRLMRGDLTDFDPQRGSIDATRTSNAVARGAAVSV
mmetsp:Transcript_13034/g.26614  ORF Transcript_13034/g.26614 Transcript_13034/m.26614 type:complete len:257 (-) Transcript_13034:84-854(-)